jgi:hypothetical protein
MITVTISQKHADGRIIQEGVQNYNNEDECNIFLKNLVNEHVHRVVEFPEYKGATLKVYFDVC